MKITRQHLIKGFYSIAPKACSQAALLRARMRSKRYGNNRQLEIGPGIHILKGFERLNIQQDGHSHYIGDARDLRIFQDDEFDYIYASHILEHIPWFEAKDALKSWLRILKPGGKLDLWVPDGYKIAKAYVDAHERGILDFRKDGWYKFNPNECHSLWFNGRTFSYGDGTANPSSPNWHRASYDRNLLINLLSHAGYKNICDLSHSDILGYDHGWINLGLRAYKK